MSAYLPQSWWYNYYTKSCIQSFGEFVNLTAPLDTIPVFVRGGYILPQQEAKPTTTESRKGKIELLVAQDEAGEAYGELFWDDGDTLSRSSSCNKLPNLSFLFQTPSKKSATH